MSFDVSRCTCAALILLVFSGCQPEATIKTYSVERTSAPRSPLDATDVLQSLDHILVAIVPQQDKAWFFKLVGKAPLIQRQREAFESFLATVKLGESSSEPPSWTLPEGWSEKEASAMRVATLVVPDEEGDLELAVSSLPLTEDWEEFLVPNVNRWLSQLQQSSLSKAAVLKLKSETPTQSTSATVFELSGMMSDRTMGTALGAGPPTTAAPTPQTIQPATAGELTYETPEGWLPGKMSSMRQAAFFLPGGGEQGEVTVTRFPASPGSQMAEVGPNVQRWAGQVGLRDLTDEKIEELTKSITISGVAGTYVELVSPAEAERSVALYAAMINRDGQVWFFKMVGKSAAVSSQRDAFREFLSSVKLP